MKRTTLYWLIFLLVIVTDRITKWLALHYWKTETVINPYVSFHQVFNRGISWGMLQSPHESVFLAITAFITLITLIMMAYAYVRFSRGCSIWGELLIIAGSCSNIFDRFFYGGVIDFIVLHKDDLEWPLFNIADSAIVLGVFVLFLQQVFAGDDEHDKISH